MNKTQLLFASALVSSSLLQLNNATAMDGDLSMYIKARAGYCAEHEEKQKLNISRLHGTIKPTAGGMDAGRDPAAGDVNHVTYADQRINKADESYRIQDGTIAEANTDDFWNGNNESSVKFDRIKSPTMSIAFGMAFNENFEGEIEYNRFFQKDLTDNDRKIREFFVRDVAAHQLVPGERTPSPADDQTPVAAATAAGAPSNANHRRNPVGSKDFTGVGTVNTELKKTIHTFLGKGIFKHKMNDMLEFRGSLGIGFAHITGDLVSEVKPGKMRAGHQNKLAQNAAEIGRPTDNDPKNSKREYKLDQTNFAVNGGLGVGLNVADGVKIVLGYDYTYIDKIKIADKYSSLNSSSSSDKNDKDEDSNSSLYFDTKGLHNGSIGVQFSL